MRILYDITHPVSESIAVWPGDAAYRYSLGMRIAAGDSVNVGAVTMSVHTGTHVDAPFHFREHGAGAGALDLAPFVGPAVVVSGVAHGEIGPDAFAGIDLAATPRVLLRTGGWPDRRVFPETIPTLSMEAVAYLEHAGVLLVGLDVPSVDAIDSKGLPIHRALDAAGIRILESVALNGVPDGVYGLIAMPLRLLGADGSPVRAVLTDAAVE